MRVDSRGRFDHTYGVNGLAPLPPGFLVSGFLADRDGRVLILGRTGRRQGMAVLRLNAAGRPDGSFGYGGLAVVGFGHHAEAKAALIEPDGRILLVGRAGTDAAAARLLPDGALDRSFGNEGRLTNLSGESGEATVVVAQPPGDLLIGCATKEPGAGSSTVLVRLGPDGRRIRSFGSGGVRQIGGRGTLLSLFTSRRRIVAVSALTGARRGGVEIRSFGPSGGDRSFGRAGVERAAVGQRQTFNPVAVARQPDGRIVVAGTAGIAGSPGSRLELLGLR